MAFIFNLWKVIFGMNNVFRKMSYVILIFSVIIQITIRSTEYFSIPFKFQCNSAIISNSHKLTEGQLSFLSHIFILFFRKKAYALKGRAPNSHTWSSHASALTTLPWQTYTKVFNRNTFLDIGIMAEQWKNTFDNF